MNHRCSVFKNSCLKVPVDPLSKMPKTAYERKGKRLIEQSSVDSVSTTESVSTADVDATKLKDFYRSIPDYNEINHLPAEQFYSTLKSLREKKQIMLGIAVEHIDDCDHHKITVETAIYQDYTNVPKTVKNKDSKSRLNYTLRRKYSAEKKNNVNDKKDLAKSDLELSSTKVTGTAIKPPSRKTAIPDGEKYLENNSKLIPNETIPVKENIIAKNRPKRHPSVCSISWNDAKMEKSEVDKKFDQFFEGRRYTSPTRLDVGDDFKTQSMPSSPMRAKRSRSPSRRRRSITVPKPFKMTERDEEERVVNELRSLRKSFSDDMLHRKRERHFRANPVPIESRIPLYDKILEDQAMRRAITKINSEAELRAQMKPFSFTKREEKGLGPSLCERALEALPKPKKKKRFKARPFPKNLFSNYFYEKMREDEFFRNMNRRIRAEEMLKGANLPGSMTARDRSRLSTPAAHSDLPIDPSPAAGSSTSSDRQRSCSPVKGRRGKMNKQDFITTSPQPFKFNTADRAAKKMLDITRKIYQESRNSDSKLATSNEGPRAYSALELRATTTGRSNLAALLRAEAVQRKFESEQARRFAEHRRKAELRVRDRLLRSKPSWHLVKNNYAEDIAMRLQTRRDEERMRREEFLHEMELMYGRVQQQPMLFERYYAPRSHSAAMDSIQLSPRKTKKRSSKKTLVNSPSRSRKVSINDTPETFNGDVAEYLNRIENDYNISDSEGPIDSARDILQKK